MIWRRRILRIGMRVDARRADHLAWMIGCLNAGWYVSFARWLKNPKHLRLRIGFALLASGASAIRLMLPKCG